MKESALDRFLRYAKIDTQSSTETNSSPSTENQFDLANLLVDELKKLGLSDANVDKHCYVTATLPSNLPQNHPASQKVPTLAFIAHLDTSPEESGANVKPQIIENYKGGDIKLPGDKSLAIKEDEDLKRCIGHKIVTSDGTTLLGADDKAGIAAIMTACQTLLEDKKHHHGPIKVCFTPDEEIGAGTDHIDLKKLNADYAYTVDGKTPGDLNKETFSANSATITCTGYNTHPGTAKGKMVNSLRAMGCIISKLPMNMAPETTDGYEPFIHPLSVKGDVTKTTLTMILRDFKTSGLDEQEVILKNIISEVQKEHKSTKIDLEIKKQYRNMKDTLDKHPNVLECLWEASKRADVEPEWVPIRGGTDGSRLTEMGLPTPNLYSGGQNYHSRTEWLSVNGMEKAVDTLINLAEIWVEKSK